ncbi:MAG: transketolase [Gracilimonas sp.]|uniref:transketolase n=1 Tax=Gracilimonas sp. TaxID=1974203 RepID=UPI001B1EF785|nr:transketolase [Gracilimonas sp.]MBO6586126.1 transketolase [Gracilimonas sp.]MBO6614783.1 transketolase [Gracilimonas sp.]
MPASKLDQLCVNTIRTLSIDAVEKANSGHPGMPMGMADAAYVLWTKFLKHNPKNPDWFDRDRFILSAGHGSMLIYSLLHLTGYEVSLEEIKNFRQMGSITPGHPEYGMTPGVETTTGPLGQGFGTGVGMAMAEHFMSAKFNKEGHNIVDHYTYAIVSDGDLMEGISHEAASMAGHMGLGKLIYLYDSNSISIEGSTDLAFTEDVPKRFESYNWHVVEIDGHNHDEITAAIEEAQSVTDKPSIIVCTTHIGYGSPNKQDSESSHGSPLGEEEIKLTKEAYGWDPEKKFFIPEEALAKFREEQEKGEEAENAWKEEVAAYEKAYTEEGKIFKAWVNRDLSSDLESKLPVFEEDAKGMASRAASGKVINAIKEIVPNLFGGSADLGGSTKTDIDGYGSYLPGNPTGRTIHYGVREHAMGAAVNGMALHGGLVPYGATFFVFTDYMRPAIRLAGLMKVPSIFVLTHDSIGLGEDGPTHQPVEHLASLRAMPNITILRPGDANETSHAWKAALENTTGPTLLVLTRQNLPTLSRSDENSASMVSKGAYIYSDAEKEIPDAILIGTGSELHLAVEAKAKLADKGIDARVVSMPSWELFERQDASYKESVLPKAVTNRISIEAGATFGWERYIGPEGTAIGLNSFGESAPYEELFEHFGITTDAIVEAAAK